MQDLEPARKNQPEGQSVIFGKDSHEEASLIRPTMTPTSSPVPDAYATEIIVTVVNVRRSQIRRVVCNSLNEIAGEHGYSRCTILRISRTRYGYVVRVIVRVAPSERQARTEEEEGSSSDSDDEDADVFPANYRFMRRWNRRIRRRYHRSCSVTRYSRVRSRDRDYALSMIFQN